MPAKRRLTRKTVIEAAAEMLDEGEQQELTLGKLAQRLGIRTPSLYHHIDSLDDLHQGIAVLGVRELSARIGKAAIGKSGGAALESIAWSYRQFARERPGLYRATQRAPRLDQTELEEAAQEVLDILGVILEPFGLSDEEKVHAIRSLRSLVHGFVSLETAGGFGLPIDLDESYRWLVRMYISQIDLARAGALPDT